MDFCAQPPVKMSICAEKLLINCSENVSPPYLQSPLKSLCLWFKNIFCVSCFSLSVSSILYRGLIRVIFDVHPSLNLLRFLFKVSFPLQSGFADLLRFSAAAAS